MMSKKKEALDRALAKVVSRKLLVWVVATVMLVANKLQSSEWMQICLIYLGAQAITSGVAEYVRAKQGLPPADPAESSDPVDKE